MLNQNSTIPLYEQVKESIKQKIEQKEWTENSRVPSEIELMKMYEVSRVTVRNALTILVDEGYLEKKQGIGTFVSKPRIKKIIFHRASFTQSCVKAGLKPSAQVLKKEVIEGKNYHRKNLQLEADDKIVHIERLRFADNDPVSLEHMYLSYKKYDYISGYLIVPRILGTVFSGMAEITVLILAAVLFIVLLIFLAVLIISCILIKKRKLKADAWMKIIVFSIFTCVAAFLIQSSVIAVLMAVPVVLGAYVLTK